MWKNVGVEQCLSFINCQLGAAGKSGLVEPAIRPAVTLSRMAGAGGRIVAGKLAEYLQACAPVNCRWTVFDRDLIEKVLEDHHLSKRLAEFMPENHKPVVKDIVEELLGLHPSSWLLVKQTTETIWRLAQMGYVILVGRGANVIARNRENAFHVRLVGSLETRTERIRQISGFDLHHARKAVEREDRGRRRYLREHFHEDIDDPTLYHLVINTDRISHDEAAQLIAKTVIARFRLNQRTEPVLNWRDTSRAA